MASAVIIWWLTIYGIQVGQYTDRRICEEQVQNLKPLKARCIMEIPV